MDVQWRSWRPRWCSGRSGQDKLKLVAVGDPDPTTAARPAAHGYCQCRFEWADQPSGALILLWFCTRKAGHHGQHLAGTGEQVAAIHPQ